MVVTQKHETTHVRQQQIIDAARKLIIKYGSEHVTVRSIAKEVGFTEGAIYRHFQSKKDILSLLAENIEDELLADLSGSAVDNSPLRKLELVLAGHLSGIERRRGVSFQVIAEILSFGDRNLNRKVSRIIERYVGRLKEILRDGVRAGEVREDLDLEAAATLLFGMVQGLVNIWALGDYAFNPEHEYHQLWMVFREAVIKR
jgi:AcrR family transcriptional regulator